MSPDNGCASDSHWRPLTFGVRYGHAVHNFTPLDPNNSAPEGASGFEVALSLGDEVYVFEECEGWYRGYVITETIANRCDYAGDGDGAIETPAFVGIFPKDCIYVQESMALQEDADGTDTPWNAFKEAMGSVMSVPTPTARRRSCFEKERRRATAFTTPPASPGGTRTRMSSSLISATGPHTSSVYPRTPRTPGTQTPSTCSTPRPRSTFAHGPPPPIPGISPYEESRLGKTEPIVDEISAACKEWYAALPRLLASSQYDLFAAVSGNIDECERVRREMSSGALTQEEMRRVREGIVNALAEGNKLIGADLIVRSAVDGQIEGGDHGISPIRLMVKQAALTSSASPTGTCKGGVFDQHPFSESAESTPLSKFVLVDVRAFVANICNAASEQVECRFFLYSGTKYITEPYVVSINSQGVPTDGDGVWDDVRMFFDGLSLKECADSVHLVCRIYKIETLILAAASTRTHTSSGESKSSKTSRKSAFFGVNGSKASLHLRPPRTAGSGRSAGAHEQDCRRPFGCAVLDISRFVQSKEQLEGGQQIMRIFTPAARLDGSGHATLHEDIIHSRVNLIEKNARADSLHVNVRVFSGTNVDGLARAWPTVLQGVTIIPRYGFTADMQSRERSDLYVELVGADVLGSVGASLLTGKNGGTVPLSPFQVQEIYVACELRTNDGHTLSLPSVSNLEDHDAWVSAIAGFRDPTWCESLKVELDDLVWHEAHLCFSVRAVGSETPLASAFLPLFDRSRNTFVKDGDHDLYLYMYDPVSDRSPSTYLQYRPTYGALGKPLAALKIKTRLCSTTITQDQALSSLLEWKEVLARTDVNGPEALEEVLKQVCFVPEIEFVKFLKEVFDALFGILVEANPSGRLDDLVFEVLVVVLGVVSDRRFTHFKHVVDNYMNNQFNYPFATANLVRCIQRLLSHPTTDDNARQLRAMMKVWQHIVRFIVLARQKQRHKEIGLGINAAHNDLTFVKALRGMLGSLNSLMATGSPQSILGTQTIAIQHFGELLPVLASVFPKEEVFGIAVNFVKSCRDSRGQQDVYKLLLILNLCRSPMFTTGDLHRELITHVVTWLQAAPSSSLPLSPRSPLSPTLATNSGAYTFARIRLSMTIFAVLLDQLWSERLRVGDGAKVEHDTKVAIFLPMLGSIVEMYDDLRTSSPARSLGTTVLFPESYPLPTRTLDEEGGNGMDEGLCEVTSLILTLFRLASQDQFSSYFYSIVSAFHGDIVLHLTKVLNMLEVILEPDTFPDTWLNVRALVHRGTVDYLEHVCDVLRSHLLPQPEIAEIFPTELWQRFFMLLLKVIGSDALAVETLSIQNRRAAWLLIGDLRSQGAYLLGRAWSCLGWTPIGDDNLGLAIDRLGGYQVQFAPCLISKLVEIALSNHEELRVVAARILQTMVVNEYNLSESLTVVHEAMIHALDAVFNKKPALADQDGKDLFVGILRDGFDQLGVPPEFLGTVEDLLGSLDRFLSLLGRLYSLPDGEAYDYGRYYDTLKLLEFIKDIEEDIYVRYVHTLVELHVEQEHFVEAALALQMHADLYSWDDTEFMPEMTQPEFPRQTPASRKEALHLQMIDYYVQGRAWEYAIEVCKTLSSVYETRTFEYAKLSAIHLRQAQFLNNIVSDDRTHSEFFRVAFYGLGFPPVLRNRQFIFEGAHWEKLPGFVERMQVLYPKAELLPANLALPDVLGQQDSQYLQINAVQPEPDRTHAVFLRRDVSTRIKEHYVRHGIRHFSYTRPVSVSRMPNTSSSCSEFSVLDLWTEKTLYTTDVAFPTIIRRAEIAGVGIVRSSPLENALGAVLGKNEELMEFECRYGQLGACDRLSPFSMSLSGAVDSPINGGIQQYRAKFLSDEYRLAHEDNAETIERLEAAINVQVEILQRCLEIHGRLVSAEMRPLHDSLKSLFRRNFASDLNRLTVTSDRSNGMSRLSPISAISNGKTSTHLYKLTLRESMTYPNLPPVKLSTSPRRPMLGRAPHTASFQGRTEWTLPGSGAGVEEDGSGSSGSTSLGVPGQSPNHGHGRASLRAKSMVGTLKRSLRFSKSTAALSHFADGFDKA
ncbi:Deoxycytidine kinase 1 [Saitoella coloradoensis]